MPRKLKASILVRFALGTEAASFFVEANSSENHRLFNKKDIADGPTLVVTPKLFFESRPFILRKYWKSEGKDVIYINLNLKPFNQKLKNLQI